MTRIIWSLRSFIALIICVFNIFKFYNKIFLIIKLTAANGETKLHSAIIPLSANNFATSATLRMFSSRSSLLNPRSLFSPVRILSPSRPYAGIPRDINQASSSNDIDVLPAPDSPVNERTLLSFFVKRNYFILEFIIIHYQ